MAGNRSDEELLQAARAGDAEALESLLGRYQDRVYGFGMRMCGDPEDARDVLQETLFAVARTFRDFRGASSVSTWLYSIARSFCVKKRRRGRSVPAEPFSARSEEHTPVLQVADPRPGPAEHAEQREIEAALARAIASLAPAAREVLVLRDIEGLSASQVAEVLGIRVDAVKSRLHRARLAVRTALAPVLAGVADRPLPDASRGCPDVIRLFSRHLEGEIDADLCATMQRHVDACPWCKTACESLQRSLHVCRTAAAPTVPEPVQESVRAELRRLVGASRLEG